MSTLNLFVLIQAISLFEFFKDLDINDKFIIVISRLSTYTFGIYIVHVLILEWANELNVFWQNEIMGIRIARVLIVPIRVVIIWLLSFLFIWILRKIYKIITMFFHK